MCEEPGHASSGALQPKGLHALTCQTQAILRVNGKVSLALTEQGEQTWGPNAPNLVEMHMRFWELVLEDISSRGFQGFHTHGWAKSCSEYLAPGDWPRDFSEGEVVYSCGARLNWLSRPRGPYVTTPCL